MSAETEGEIPNTKISSFKCCNEQHTILWNVLLCSDTNKSGIKPLLYRIAEIVAELPAPEAYHVEEEITQLENENEYEVSLDKSTGIYYVKGGLINKLGRRIDPNDEQSMNFFQHVLRESGIIDALEDLGIEEGDMVRLLDVEFEYIP